MKTLSLCMLAFSNFLYSQNLLLSLSSPVVVTNGFNFTILTIKHEEGGLVPLSSWCNKEALKINTSMAAEISEPMVASSCEVKITPRLSASSDQIHNINVVYDSNEYTAQLKTTISPIKGKLVSDKYPGASETIYGETVSYIRYDQAPKGEFHAFQIENSGPNAIVRGGVSMLRSYEFSFENVSSQNLAMNVTDFPNEYTSQTMYSHFMIFPRKVLPYVSIDDLNNHIEVTLPNEEKITFSNTGEIIDGVFSEGPLDVSSSMTKRKFADLNYTGKGILLRVNSRGQLPQQGESRDVLIINGTTAQRCIRPKIDFWPKEDRHVITFKFPTDNAFDQYLKKYCGFGIP